MLIVSVIVPCYNEEATIQLLLEAIEQQTFPHEQFEVIISDGISTDRTRIVIREYQDQHPGLEIKVVDNSKKIIPAALNRALEAAAGRYIIRLDAHSMPYPDYIENCVRDLAAGCGDNVGGVWEIQPGRKGNLPPSWMARGIAAATAHPFGVGDAQYRFTNQAQYVDTVPFGAFEAKLIEKIGFFDETLQTNEDYEFNVRIRQSGGRIWLNPAIRSVYFARPTLMSLIKQYLRYGYWKGRMLYRYPNTLRWRQLLPPLFVACFISLFLLTALNGWFGLLLILQISLYGFVLFLVGINVSWKKKDFALLISMPLAISAMHLTWGSSILWSLLTLSINKGLKSHAS
jgi:succinoglycan biosynthesis protein ExoA